MRCQLDLVVSELRYTHGLSGSRQFLDAGLRSQGTGSETPASSPKPGTGQSWTLRNRFLSPPAVAKRECGCGGRQHSLPPSQPPPHPLGATQWWGALAPPALGEMATWGGQIHPHPAAPPSQPLRAFLLRLQQKCFLGVSQPCLVIWCEGTVDFPCSVRPRPGKDFLVGE